MSVSVKTTRKVTETIEPGTTKISYSTDYGGDHIVKRSVIGSRAPIMINRTSGQFGGGGMQMSRQVSYGYGAGMGMGAPSGAYEKVSAVGVANVKNSREREKKDMQDLNERFASYIEKVRFLEAQNRKLAEELDHLKKQWGRETQSVKTMYQVELDEARKLLDEVEKDKARLELRNATLEEQLIELRAKLDELKELLIQRDETIEKQHTQLSEYEGEINLLRRRIGSLEAQRDKDKKEIDRLSEALNRARMDLDQETLLRIQAENRAQTLEEELEFLKNVHEQEMKEMAALAYRDTTKENRDFWKNELGQCLREIQEMYDGKLEAMRGELESYYNMKCQEFRTGATRQGMETTHAKEESKRLRTQLSDLRAKLADMEARNAQLEKELELLRREFEEKEREWEQENQELKIEVSKLRAEMEAILKELQDLMDTKLGLELEIAAYRKLLEGEENRKGKESLLIESAGRQRYDADRGAADTKKSSESPKHSSSDPDDSSLRMSQVVKGEMSAKTTYQRSAKGPVSIAECSAEGTYIVLENNGKKEENIGGLKIVREIDGKRKITFTIPHGTVLGYKAGEKQLRIFSKSATLKRDPNSNVDPIKADEDWGIGANILTKLCNEAGEERATHNQKTQYVS